MIYQYRQKNKQYNLPNGSDFLENLKKINIFVGSNNAGKSRFLRDIFLSEENSIVFYGEDYNSNLLKIIELLPEQHKNLYFSKDLRELTNSKTGNYGLRYNQLMTNIKNSTTRSNGTGNIWDSDIAESIRVAINTLGNIPTEIPVINNKPKFVYIPILRGIRQIDLSSEKIDEKKDLYKLRTQLDYNFSFEEGAIGNKEIFSGASIYRDIRKMLLGSKDSRKFVKRFEDFLAENFFRNKPITLIPDHDTDSIKINIGNGEDRKIHDVGDGIQSIIISTFPAFNYQGEDLVLCIEEPEMTMHPSIQRILIDTLVKFPNLQVFLTTHSNHFLDLSYDYPSDIGIFSFEKIDEDDEFYIKNITDNSSIIDLLGVRSSSVFLANSVIWTEGVTDRMLIRKLLELAEFNFKEDYHYALSEYGGNNLDNFNYSDGLDRNKNALKVTSISKRNLVIIDNDNITDTSDSKYVRRENIKNYLGKEGIFDEYIEIENLIPGIVWVSVIEKLLLLKSKKNIKFKDNFRDNLSQFDQRLKTEKIGIILKDLLIESIAAKAPDYYTSDNIQCLGEDKKYVMQLVIESIDELKIKLSDFPTEAQRLIEAILSFVKKANNK